MITLVGLPGSGKTTIGRQLARRLKIAFFDSDHFIESRVGCSVREYFEREGEDAFRNLEEAVLDELTSDGVDKVLSTGGGAVLRTRTRCCLHGKSLVVYLRSHPEDLFRRLKTDTTRPLLQVSDPLAKLRELFAQRDPLYRETAHFVVETRHTSAPALLNLILMQLELSGSGAQYLRMARKPFSD